MRKNLLLCALLLLQTGIAAAQVYPAKPIRMIAPISAGGGADVAARLLAKTLSDDLRQQVIVDNRPGGGNIIGTSIAANAAADGYTILWVSGAHAINAALGRKLPYDSIRDFTPVSLFAKLPLLLIVHPSQSAKSLPELLKQMRAQPGKFNYASSGVGSASHLGLEMLKLYAGVDMVNVSYKGSAPSIVGLLSGEVQMALLGPLSVKPLVTAGKVRPLAVSTPQRSAAFPDLPTIAESGVPKYDMTGWYGILAPHGTPQSAVVQLNRAVARAQTEPSLRNALAPEGADLVAMTPQQFEGYIRTQIAQFTELLARLKQRTK
ncbi:MAG: tripartite tricarboxylate transporter substrate binding protein [Burkholderiales bacterium]